MKFCLREGETYEMDIISSPSSDEKMDTASECYRFKSLENTPDSVLSPDFEDSIEHNPMLRLSELEQNDNMNASKLQDQLSDSLVTKMSQLTINSQRPKHLTIKSHSKLKLTTNHPLMTLGSPEDNFPNIVPKKTHKAEDEKDLSVSSADDEKIIKQTNGYEIHSSQNNSSKNNLYFSENFITADSQLLNDSISIISPIVEQVNPKERRKIIPMFTETPRKSPLTQNRDHIVPKTKQGISSQSTPKSTSGATIVTHPEEFHFGDLDSPDALSSSTQDDKSAYQALLDPYTGCVALRPRVTVNPVTPRRKIQLPPEDDQCSLDSVSACSLESEEEPPEPVIGDSAQIESEVDDTKRSKSTNTVSECSDQIPEYSAAEELHDERSWITVQHSGRNATCDMKVIEPYKRVLSHGGYESSGAAIIVFSACHLPETARPDYRYVMDNLFLYVIWSLERLVTDEYVLVYLHGSAGRRRLPTFTWLHECFKLIDRRLRKSLKHLYLVHPTFWLKSFVVITKPFVSSKFFRKLSYVRNLKELMEQVPVEPNAIPELVKQYDATRR